MDGTSHRLIPGELISLNIENRTFSEEGFALGGQARQGGMRLYEHIELCNFPSSNDFMGDSTIVRHGAMAVVIKYLGRPGKLSAAPSWELYDAYEIMVDGRVRHVFRYNLERLNNEPAPDTI